MPGGQIKYLVSAVVQNKKYELFLTSPQDDSRLRNRPTSELPTTEPNFKERKLRFVEVGLTYVPNAVHDYVLEAEKNCPSPQHRRTKSSMLWNTNGKAVAHMSPDFMFHIKVYTAWQHVESRTTKIR